MSSLATSVTFILVASLVLIAILLYLLLSKVIDKLDEHLERIQGKLDVIQMLLESLMDRLR